MVVRSPKRELAPGEKAQVAVVMGMAPALLCSLGIHLEECALVQLRDWDNLRGFLPSTSPGQCQCGHCDIYCREPGAARFKSHSSLGSIDLIWWEEKLHSWHRRR